MSSIISVGNHAGLRMSVDKRCQSRCYLLFLLSDQILPLVTVCYISRSAAARVSSPPISKTKSRSLNCVSFSPQIVQLTSPWISTNTAKEVLYCTIYSFFFFPFLQLGIVVRNIRQRGARHQSEVTLMLRRALPRH